MVDSLRQPFRPYLRHRALTVRSLVVFTRAPVTDSEYSGHLNVDSGQKDPGVVVSSFTFEDSVTGVGLLPRLLRVS